MISPGWIAYHFSVLEPCEPFLRDCIAAIVENLSHRRLITSFFFVRFPSPSAHIRLRVRVSDCREEARLNRFIIRAFRDFQASNDGRALRIVRKRYRPEVFRYGGPIAIRIAEQQFCLSSRLILRLLRSRRGWTYDTAFTWSLMLGFSLLIRLPFDRLEMIRFCTSSLRSYHKILIQRPTVERAIVNGYEEALQKQRAKLFALFDSLLAPKQAS